MLPECILDFSILQTQILFEMLIDVRKSRRTCWKCRYPGPFGRNFYFISPNHFYFWELSLKVKRI